jgi:hypothetical protein
MITMWINKSRFDELIEIEKKYQEESMMAKSKRAEAVLRILGVKAESAKQIKEALAMEILSEEFEMQDKYSKAVFVKTQGADVMSEVRELLESEGVLTKKRLTHKKVNKGG